jgi:hypothetical protein
MCYIRGVDLLRWLYTEKKCYAQKSYFHCEPPNRAECPSVHKYYVIKKVFLQGVYFSTNSTDQRCVRGAFLV